MVRSSGTFSAIRFYTLAIAISCGAIVSQPAVDAALWRSVVSQPTPPKRVFHVVRERGGGGMNIDVADRPLLSTDVDRWATILVASEEQRYFMDVMYERFVERFNDQLEQEIPVVLTLSLELDAIRREHGLSSAEFTIASKAMDRSTSRLRERLTLIEMSFIDSIVPVLTMRQQDRVGILRLEVTRRNCRIARTGTRWADIELRIAWLDSADGHCTNSEWEAVDDLLGDYERRLTQFLCLQANNMARSRSQLRENRILRKDGRRSAEEANARYDRIISDRVDLAKSVRLLHEQTVQHIVAIASHDCSSPFLNHVRRIVYPELYPDPTSLHSLFKALRADVELSPEEETIVASLSQAYEARYRTETSRLEMFCAHWNEREYGGDPEYVNGDFGESLMPLLRERTLVSKSFLDAVQEELGQDVLMRHSAAFPSIAGEP